MHRLEKLEKILLAASLSLEDLTLHHPLILKTYYLLLPFVCGKAPLPFVSLFVLLLAFASNR